MSNRTRTARRLLTTLLAVALCTCLLSCETTSPNANKAKPIVTNPTPAQAMGDPTVDKEVGAMINRLDMPLDVSLDDCWAQVDELEVPKLMHGLWQANGLRIGVLHAENAEAFAKALPPIYGESQAKLYSSHYPTAARSTPRLLEPVMVDLTVPPKSPTEYKAIDGRLQLLIRIGRSETGLAFVELTPHHYKQKTDLIPRSPLEKQLDGRVFRELSALLPITTDTAIIIGLNRPWPEQDTSVTAEAAEDAEKNTAVSETESESSEPEKPEFKVVDKRIPPVPEGLGKSLMTGIRAGQPTQMLMVISLIEDPFDRTPEDVNIPVN